MPAGERSEQSVKGILQDRGVVTELGQFAERLVDDRVESDEAADELAPNRLGFLKPGTSAGQCAGEPAADLDRNGGEEGGEPAPGAAQISYS